MYKLLELSKREFPSPLSVHLCKGLFKSLVWNLIFSVSKHDLNFFEGNSLIVIYIEFVEQSFKLFLSHKLLTINASNNEFAISDLAIV